MTSAANALFFPLLLSVSCLSGADPVDVPCDACPEFRRPPLPESGIWSDPQRFGTGFTLNLQRRTMGGAYFGYAPDGRAVWYVFTGPLMRAAAGADHAWSLDATAIEFHGGACLECPHTPPDAGTPRHALRFEFQQRSLARVRVGDGPWALIRPQTYGVATSREFAPEVSFPVPDLQGPWVLVFQDLGAQGDAASRVAYAVNATRDVSPPGDRRILSGFFESSNASEATIVADLDCKTGDDGTPICSLKAYSSRIQGAAIKEFILPLGNLSASRIKGEAADGETVEGFRIDHD
jgi:hypothetical protein